MGRCTDDAGRRCAAASRWARGRRRRSRRPRGRLRDRTPRARRGRAGAAPAPGTPRTPPAPRPRRTPPRAASPGSPSEIAHGPRDRPRVALTFHGHGDPAIARALLGRGRDGRGARVTVLAVGSWLDAHPDMARRILDGGHELGNHTQRHLDINAMAEARRRTRRSPAAPGGCARLTGSIGTWFRPSPDPDATPLVQTLARRAGYPHVLSYDVDSLDFTSPGAPAVIRKVTGEIRHGSVVSLHFGYADTVAALPRPPRRTRPPRTARGDHHGAAELTSGPVHQRPSAPAPVPAAASVTRTAG